MISTFLARLLKKLLLHRIVSMLVSRIVSLPSFSLFGFQPFHPQFILYCVIGLSGLVLDTLCFIALKTLMHYQRANLIAMHIGLINNFRRNAKYTFKKRDKLLSRFATSYGIALVSSFALSAFLLYLFVEIADFPVLAAKLITLVFIAIIQFLANKHISFR